jgi:hypothetical protein
MQGAAIALLLLAFGGGALGASAAAGFGPSQVVLSSLGVIDPKGGSEDKAVVDDEESDDDETPEPTKTDEADKKTPVSVVVPSKSPTPEKPDDVSPGPTDKPADREPTKQPDRPKPTSAQGPAPTVPHAPTPIPVDLDSCIPASVYQQVPALHAYDVKVCSPYLQAALNDTFKKGLCLPKDVADAYPFLLDLGIAGCTSEQEGAIQQHLFFKGWCAPEKAAEFLASLGYNVHSCTPHKVKTVLLHYKDNDPCGINWAVLPKDLVC